MLLEDSDTVYFTAGPFDESHGLFGSLTTAAPGTDEGPAQAQLVQAHIDVVQLALQQLANAESSGAPLATIRQDAKALNTATRQLLRAQRAFGRDAINDATP